MGGYICSLLTEWYTSVFLSHRVYRTNHTASSLPKVLRSVVSAAQSSMCVREVVESCVVQFRHAHFKRWRLQKAMINRGFFEYNKTPFQSQVSHSTHPTTSAGTTSRTWLPIERRKNIRKKRVNEGNGEKSEKPTMSKLVYLRRQIQSTSEYSVSTHDTS